MHNVYLFIGQSGAGKGTQVAMLEKNIREQHPDASVLHLETGNIFRSFIQTNSYTAQKVKSYMDEGILPPSFIGIHVWSHELIEKYNGQDYIFIDGTPRIADEVPVLLSAAKFYNWKLHVIFIDVSDEWANDRLVGRGRADDVQDHDRAERIKWYHVNVAPAVAILRNAPEVYFVTVNGEQLIEDVHKDIVASLHS